MFHDIKRSFLLTAALSVCLRISWVSNTWYNVLKPYCSIQLAISPVFSTPYWKFNWIKDLLVNIIGVGAQKHVLKAYYIEFSHKHWTFKLK